MQPAQIPNTKDLVLIGGGHTHALVLRRWAMKPLAGARLTLINPGPTAPYSGMLPGFVAGHYTRHDLDIDLVKLARRSGARIILAPAAGIDLKQRRVEFLDRPAAAFDIASIDVGIMSEMPFIPGFAEHAVPAKPLGQFAQSWEKFLAGRGPANLAVVGAGVAGAELAMAQAFAMRRAGREARVVLIDRSAAFQSLPSASAARVRDGLRRLGISIREQSSVERVDQKGVYLSSGEVIEADFVTGAAGARPHDWLMRTGLELHDGFIVTDEQLRTSDPDIFAVGDCAHFAASPRPKAGVYAVRQAPVLFENLRTRLIGKKVLRRYRPQSDYLKLISLGEKAALGDRFGMTFSGGWVWCWKDRIDRKFMDKFDNLPAMPAPPLPTQYAQGVPEALGDKPACGGCGAKIGAPALRRALDSGNSDRPGDDAALLNTPGVKQVMSTDHLRAVTDDPVVMTRIAAIHALGDMWAMGAKPQAATASIILPRTSSVLAERSLAEIMQAARTVMTGAGAEIVGGHSTLGAEMTIGFTLTGLCENAPITLAGAKPGDHLILTKPIGTGVILAAEMQGRAQGNWVAATYDSMMKPQATAATLLGHAHAMTDVTGFGLIGHLGNLCEVSQVGAELDVSTIPLLPGAVELSGEGVRSTLYPENRAGHPGWPANPTTDLLFDPQTCGGLLATVAGDAVGTCDALRDAGFDAAIIGRITDRPGQIRAV